MSTIALIHEGSISIEHLASMSTNALVVQMVVKSQGAKRRSNTAKDRKPVYRNTTGATLSSPRMVLDRPEIDPANAQSRSTVTTVRWPMGMEWVPSHTNIWGDYVPGRMVRKYEEIEYIDTTTWHDQFVERGSKNEHKRYKSFGRLRDIEDRKERKAATKRQKVSTRDYVHQASIEADFDGQFPFRVTTEQTTPQAVDMFIAERMAKPAPMPHERRVATARQIVDTRDAAATQREHLGVVGIEETRLLEMETQAALVQQRIDAGAKAKPNMAALNAERADRFFDNTRRFVLANSRGI